ncbi:MAG: hypothetical protein AAF684_07680 [Pseudomonadota bacterium]
MSAAVETDPAGDVGEAVGGVLAWIADAAYSVWSANGPTAWSFVDGVLRGAGLGDATTLELVAVGGGALLIIGAGRAVFDGRIVSAVVSGAIGAALIAWAAT